MGSSDAVYHFGGLILERRFTSWLEGVGYDLEVWSRERRTALVSWRLGAAGPDESELTVTIRSRPPRRLPSPLRWLVHQAYIGPMLRRYMSRALKGLDWFVTTGRHPLL